MYDELDLFVFEESPPTCSCDAFPDATTCLGNETNRFLSVNFEDVIMLASVDLKWDEPLNASIFLIRLDLADVDYPGESHTYEHNVENVSYFIPSRS